MLLDTLARSLSDRKEKSVVSIVPVPQATRKNEQRKHGILEAVRADRVSLFGLRDVGDDLDLNKHFLVPELGNSQIRPEGGVRQPLASRRNVDVGEVLGQVDSVGDELQQGEMSK